MKVWLPYVVGGSGSDVWTVNFAKGLSDARHTAVLQPFPHWTQLVPKILSRVTPPRDTDIIVTNSGNGFAFARAGLPMLTVEHLCVHDPAFAPYRTRRQTLFHEQFVRRLERASFSIADEVVAPSRSTADAVTDAFRGVEPRVIRHGVDTEFFVPNPRYVPRSESDPFRLLFVGNLTVRKGADLLAPVMNILGSGYTLRYTVGLRERGEVDAPNTESLGRLDAEAVRGAYWDSDVLLCPSRLESGPLVAFEAMACGLPVVGSNQSSMPEAVEDGVTGLLRPLEPTVLADAVRELAGNDRLRGAMSESARQRAVQHFSLETMVTRYVDLFRELMGSNAH